MIVVVKKNGVVLQELTEAGDKFPDAGDNVSYAEFIPAVKFQGISYNRIHFKSIVLDIMAEFLFMDGRTFYMRRNLERQVVNIITPGNP